MYTPKHLVKWTRPSSYIGPDWFGYYPVMGQSRDSDTLERSNFQVALKRLGGESETVLVVRDSHWAVGWVETIYIHESDDKALETADAMRDKLDNAYPVLDEMHWSNLELQEAEDYWANMSVSERVWYCQEVGISVFAARRAELPQDDDGRLFERLTRN